MNKVKVEKYWAEWCQPCKILAPTISNLRNKYSPQGVSFVDINIDTNHEPAQKNGVRSVPTVIIYRNGNHFARITGLNQQKEYENAIESALNA